MRKVIDSINNGQINRNFGMLSFSESVIEHTISAGGICEGSFSVLATTHNLVEGYCMSNDYRMEILTKEFSGMQDEIAYRFHGEGTAPGSDIRGCFSIISNRGEYEIPFEIHVEEELLESSLGPVRNIFHFTNLAKVNWNEALNLFYNPRFIKLFSDSDREYLSTYKCLAGVPGSEQNMDEFLVAIRKKTPVEYIPSEKEVVIDDPVGVSRFSININRNGWGYTHFKIYTEGEFLEVDVNEVNLDMFLGNTYQTYFYVDADKVHSGKNYGAIIIKDERFEVRVPIQVNSHREGMHFKNMTMFRMHGIVQVMEYYQSYRLKKISSRTWMTESTRIIEEMLANDPEDLIARLYQIHLMITQERNNEAIWNLNKVKAQANSVKEDQTYLWCYYLYLCSLLEENAVESHSMTEQVEYCYKLNPDDWRIAWLLSFMSDEYRTVTRKWVMYETAFGRGCNSPVIYLEAARLVLDNPAMLSGLSGFEMQVIRYICKRGMLNDEIVFAIRTMAEHYREYNSGLLKLLEFCYRDNPHDELLMIICTQLIKGDRKDAEAFKWYSYAVKQELKITRLYEYYMMSLDKRELKEIPRIVLMYFSFHSDLDYETNAYLYAAVVNDRVKDPDMYSRYQMQISDYVSAQLLAGHNNRYLSILYRNLIDDSMLVDEKTATMVADIVFMHEADVSAYPQMKRLILCYDHSDDELSFPISDGRAVFPVYSNDYSIALEDENHNRTIGTNKVNLVQLMPPGRLLLTLQIMLKNHLGIDIHCCMEHQMSADVRNENEFRFRNLLEKKHFSMEYAQTVSMRLVRFYFERERFEELDKFLDELEPEYVAEFERSECIRYLVKRNRYMKAIDWIYKYGCEGIDKVVIGDLIYGWLPTHRDDVGIYEDLILELLLDTLSSGKTNTVCIQYLMNHVYGTIKTLRDVWRKAGELEVDRRDLEERIIIQILYSGAYIQEKGAIIEHYAYEVPDGDVLRAALASVCYEFFVRDEIISDKIFPVLTDAMETELELDKVCYLAYVKYYADNKDAIDEKTRPILKNALHVLLAQDVILACFKEYADFMPSMVSYADSTIIEYRTTPGTHVNIHFIIEAQSEDEYEAEPMNEVYGGVFTKSFTLFFGEKLMYYITEENGETVDTLSESNTIMRNDTAEISSHGRFGLINDICIGRALRDYATVDELLEEYYLKDFMASRLFGMHK